MLILVIAAAILLVEMAAAIVVLAVVDLAVGTGILAAVGRKRHLFWTLPVVNFAAWYGWGQDLFWLPGIDTRLEEMNDWLIGIADWLMHPLSFVVGLLCAGMLAPVQMIFRRVTGPRETAEAADASTGVAATEAAEKPEREVPEFPPEIVATPGVEMTAVDHVDVEPIARPAATGRWPAFREGLRTPWDGLAYMCRHPRLWKYGVMPIVANVLITGVVLLLLIAVAGFAVNSLHPKFPQGWGWLALEIVCGIMLFLLALVGAFVSWLLMQSILCGYYYGKLAREVELRLGMNPDEMHDVSLIAQTTDAIRDVTALLAVNAGLLLLHVVPVIGSVAATCGSLYFDFLILGSDFVNHSLDLRGWRRAEKRAFVRRHRYHTLGLGAVVMLMLFIPVVGAVFLTTAVTGSVLLHCRLTAGERMTAAAPPAE